jgi:hypothetical protein
MAEKPGSSSGRSPKVKRASVHPSAEPLFRVLLTSAGAIRQPGWTGVRKPQYPHRFRQTVVSGRKTFFENVTGRSCMRRDDRLFS